LWRVLEEMWRMQYFLRGRKGLREGPRIIELV